MKVAAFTLSLIFLLACSSKKGLSKQKDGIGDTRTEAVAKLNDKTFLLTETTDDKTYGYEPKNPIKVGGVKDLEGPLNERRFLNALLGPNGEQVAYTRKGSCCAFKTPNALLNNTGLVDRYEVWWAGGKDTLVLYLNMYDEGNLYIPVGFTARSY